MKPEAGILAISNQDLDVANHPLFYVQDPSPAPRIVRRDLDIPERFIPE